MYDIVISRTTDEVVSIHRRLNSEPVAKQQGCYTKSVKHYPVNTLVPVPLNVKIVQANKKSQTNPNKVVFYRTHKSLGDLVSILSAIQSYKQVYPHSHISMLSPIPNRQILKYHPDIDYLGDTSELSDISDISETTVFDLSTPCPCGIYENTKGDKVDKSRNEIFTLACGLEWTNERPRIYLTDEEKNIQVEDNAVGLVLRSAEKFKDYPYMQELADKLLDKGKIVYTFDKEQELEGCINITGENIRTVAVYMYYLSVVIGPDTGLMHICDALDTKYISLFGSMNGQLHKDKYDNSIKIIQGHCPYRKQPCIYDICKDISPLPCMTFPPQIIFTFLDNKKETLPKAMQEVKSLSSIKQISSLSSIEQVSPLSPIEQVSPIEPIELSNLNREQLFSLREKLSIKTQKQLPKKNNQYEIETELNDKINHKPIKHQAINSTIGIIMFSPAPTGQIGGAELSFINFYNYYKDKINVELIYTSLRSMPVSNELREFYVPPSSLKKMYFKSIFMRGTQEKEFKDYLPHVNKNRIVICHDWGQVYLMSKIYDYIDKTIVLNLEAQLELSKRGMMSSILFICPNDVKVAETPTPISNNPIIGYIGRLGPKKRIERIIIACEKIGYKLIIAGEGSERTYLESIADKNTEFIGWVSGKDKENFFNNINILTLTSDFETAPAIIPEAMYRKTPLISTKVGNIIDLKSRIPNIPIEILDYSKPFDFNPQNYFSNKPKEMLTDEIIKKIEYTKKQVYDWNDVLDKLIPLTSIENNAEKLLKWF